MEELNKKHLQLDLTDTQQTALICKALSNETRLQILRCLTERAMTISELAGHFYLPMSSMCLHIRILKEAGLLNTIARPGSHGTQKLCSICVSDIAVDLFSHRTKTASLPAAFVEMPIGHYASCQVFPPCGLASSDSYLHYEDSPHGFYSPKRTEASMIWFSKGYLEYQFSNYALLQGNVRQVEFSFEICSEAPGYNNRWPSDITLEINHMPVVTFTTAGDYGGRRGIYNPPWWSDSNTQFGEYKKITLTHQGCYLDDVKVSDATISSLSMQQGYHFFFTLKVDEKSRHVGGLNLFGKCFGDYAQDIVMKVIYV